MYLKIDGTIFDRSILTQDLTWLSRKFLEAFIFLLLSLFPRSTQNIWNVFSVLPKMFWISDANRLMKYEKNTNYK